MGGGPQPLPKLDRWDMKLGPKLIEKGPSASGGQKQEESHAHSVRGFEWPAWVVEKIAPKDDDSAGLKAAKIGLVIISPVIIGPLALAGAAVDHVEHFYDFMVGWWLGPIFDEVDWFDWKKNLPDYSRTPDVSPSGSPEEGSMKTSDVAHLPPLPPVPERPRERNKCGAAARGGRR